MDVWEHKCYIQSLSNRRAQATSTGAPVDYPEEHATVKTFFDCECMQEEGEAHQVNLVCAETNLDDQRYQFPSMQEFMA